MTDLTLTAPHAVVGPLDGRHVVVLRGWDDDSIEALIAHLVDAARERVDAAEALIRSLTAHLIPGGETLAFPSVPGPVVLPVVVTLDADQTIESVDVEHLAQVPLVAQLVDFARWALGQLDVDCDDDESGGGEADTCRVHWAEGRCPVAALKDSPWAELVMPPEDDQR